MDLKSTESWYNANENNEEDMKGEGDKQTLEAPERERRTFIADFLVPLTPVSCETWLVLVPAVL